MVETITPAGCGSRHRHRLAIALFGSGALLAAAALGAALGAAGVALGRSWALPAAAALALLAAAREAGLVRLPVPMLRRQVPERWRREWPLPAWSLAYGAGLGVGVATHQAVATFWVAAAGAAALGDPLVSAACMAPFGLGRALMVALPARGGRDPAEAVGRLAARGRRLRAANAVALVAVAALVAAAPAAAQQPDLRGRHDPAVSGRVLASAVAAGGGTAVVVQAPGRRAARFPGGRRPALDRGLLAYADDDGIRVVRWQPGEEVARIPGRVESPAIRWPHVAYVRRAARGARLEVMDMRTRVRRVIAAVGRGIDLGRPALRDGWIAWHVAAGRDSRVLVRPLARGGRAIVVARSATSVHVNPSLHNGHIAWVVSSGERSDLLMRRIRGRRVVTLATIRGPDRILWTTALGPRGAHVTRWALAGGRATVLRRAFRPLPPG